MAARLKELYLKEIAPAIAKEFGIANPMAIPKVTKVVVNMGIGEGATNSKMLDVAAEELKTIVDRKSVV